MKKLFFAILLLLSAVPGGAFAAEHRIALVIGNANYETGALPTPANDAGLIAQTLQAAGFDVTGARDLNQDSLRQAFRDFLEKARGSGPDTVAYIYLSGYGLQLEGENYFAPIDARIPSDANVPSEALRLSDYLKPLAALHLKVSIVVLDLARANPYAKGGTPLTGGLALVEPDPNTLIAFNAAPGTVGPNEAGPYSAYAQALAEISREGGVGLDEVFTRVRLRVNQLTNGAEVPWQSAKLDVPLYLFDKAPDAPPPAVSSEQTSSIRTKPIGDFDARDAYLAALDRDTLQGYLDFVAAFPRDPMIPRVRAIIAARREAIIWRRTRNIDTPRAYWSYLRRYPRGAHSYDARRRLRELAAAFEPPPSFEVIEYDVPPPPPEEIVYVERPVLVFDDPDFDFMPPPPPPVIFLPPPPVYFVDLPPPPPPLVAFMLPMPEYRPVPVWVAPPRQIAPPPANIIYNNIHNTVVINNTTNMVTITNPQGQTQTVAPAVAAAPLNRAGSPAPTTSTTAPSTAGKIAAGVAVVGAAAALAPSLPPSIAKKAATIPNPKPVAPAKPLAPGHVLRVQSTAPAVSPALGGTPSSRSKNQMAPAQTAPAKPPITGPTAVSPPKSSTQSGKPQLGKPLPGAPGGKALPGSESNAPAPHNENRAPITAPVTRTQPATVAPKSTARPATSPAPATRPSTAEPVNRPQLSTPSVPKAKQAPVLNAPRGPTAPIRHAPQTTPQQNSLRSPSLHPAERAVVHAPPPAKPLAPTQAHPAPPRSAAPQARPAPPQPRPAASQARPAAPQARRAAPAKAKAAPKACVLPDGKPCAAK